MTSKLLTSVAAAAIALSLGPAVAQDGTQDPLQVPKAEERANDAPMTQEPMTQEPMAAEPAAENPLAEEPVADEQVQAEAGDVNEALDPSGKFVFQQQQDHWLTSNLIGEDVNTPDGETIGEVVALEIGPEQKVVAVVIDAGGFLGLGAKRIAVPYESVDRTQPEDGDPYLVADLSRDEIETAPEYLTLEEKRQAEEQANAAQQNETASPLETEPTTAQ